ncbi:MAG TPA: VWA domain-containing protein [Bryobacteraceae bacterium]|nr:VWA domain-containing protein [Bryobacteraceae bacterium]
MSLMRLFLLCLCLSLQITGAAAQTAESAADHTFRSGVANVRIDVQVTDGGDLVRDLTQSDFAVFDEGRLQPLVYFGRDAEPLSLILLIDASGSMREYVEQVAAVARQSLRHLRSGDRVSVMSFARDARVHLDWTDRVSEVAQELRSAAGDQSLGAGTNINDALVAAAKHMAATAGPTGRRAVLILTDNLGLNYQSPDAPVIDAMNAAETVVNAIVVGKGRRPEPVPGGIYRNPDFTVPDVFTISEQTGGEAVKVTKAGQAFATMIERIRMRYALHYNVPEGAAPGKFRKVEVSLTQQARARYPNAVLRHRPGYRTGS